MAVFKFLLLLSTLFLLFSAIASTHSSKLDGEELSGSAFPAEDSDTSAQVEFSQLQFKFSRLEAKLEEKSQELSVKEKTAEELENLIMEKSNSLASLQSRLQSLDENVSLNTKGQEGNAQARATQLKEQISTLKKEIEAQNEKKVDLEARAKVAEMKIHELNMKLEDLRRTREEQKSRMSKTRRALEVAEEELVKAKLEVSSVSRKLAEVREAWIPHWLAIHFHQGQDFVITKWNKRVRPILDLTIKKAADRRTELENWAKPYFNELKSKWIPHIKEHGLAIQSDFGLRVQSLTATAIDKYHTSINLVKPYYFTFKDVTDPHIEEAKKCMKPYVDQVSAVSKPYVDKAYVYVKPYTKQVRHKYKSISRKWSLYHRQVQKVILDNLKSHEFTRPYATKVFAWYTALAIMALPILLVLNMLSGIFSEKPKKRRRTSHSSQTRRKSKRVHHER